jgi:hypothetical protein
MKSVKSVEQSAKEKTFIEFIKFIGFVELNNN